MRSLNSTWVRSLIGVEFVRKGRLKPIMDEVKDGRVLIEFVNACIEETLYWKGVFLKIKISLFV